MFCFCFFRAFVPNFYFKLCSFVYKCAKIFFSPGHWVPYSYATGFWKQLLVSSGMQIRVSKFGRQRRCSFNNLKVCILLTVRNARAICMGVVRRITTKHKHIESYFKRFERQLLFVFICRT